MSESPRFSSANSKTVASSLPYSSSRHQRLRTCPPVFEFLNGVFNRRQPCSDRPPPSSVTESARASEARTTAVSVLTYRDCDAVPAGAKRRLTGRRRVLQSYRASAFESLTVYTFHGNTPRANIGVSLRPGTRTRTRPLPHTCWYHTCHRALRASLTQVDVQ